MRSHILKAETWGGEGNGGERRYEPRRCKGRGWQEEEGAHGPHLGGEEPDGAGRAGT